jgi:choline dehydrogenase
MSRVAADQRASDVVVVGGGAAGCVVAARLSETPERRVLLLEAGTDLRANVPYDMRDGWHLPRISDWGYASEPDSHGSTQPLRRVKLLGGTSWLTRFAVRGSPADYNEWSTLGNPGWRFEDVLPYLKRLETDLDFGDAVWHGDNGPLPVTRYRERHLTGAAAAALEALEAVGFAHVDDHNRPGAVGAGRMPMSSRDGARVTTADAYLPEEGTRSNLVVRTQAHVAEVVIEGNRASGVRLLDGSVIEAGWVVLSAGTFGTPPVLMRSGIGPEKHLRSLGIQVRLDLPGVGGNLIDHVGVDIDCGFRQASRKAPIFHLLATFHSTMAPAGDAPDLALWISDPFGDPPVLEIDVGLWRPRSRGSVRLRSADPADPPCIELPGLRESADVDRLAEAFLRGLEVAHRPEVRKLCQDTPSPRAHNHDEARAVVRAGSYSFPHVVGTCAMGPSPDDGAVVDASGRVHGIEHLSVVDASVIPNATSAFTHIPTIMLAERLSDEIARSYA